jgi:hypothetical protein
LRLHVPLCGKERAGCTEHVDNSPSRLVKESKTQTEKEENDAETERKREREKNDGDGFLDLSSAFFVF